MGAKSVLEITQGSIDTELADLRGFRLDELCQRQLQDALVTYRDDLINQVERARNNLGSGPPGRAD